jgi:Fe-S cluster biosynthesis and repair protein YggX
MITMSDADNRIEQFKKMANDDPNNELGHFSLGRAYLEGGRAADAAASFERVIQINPNQSKAYEHLGQALLAAGRREDAIARLTAGVQVAHSRGDLMPRNNMRKMLQDLGAPVPELAEAATTQPAAGEGEVLCRRCGKVKPRLAKQPFKSDFGKQIYENVCNDCWQEAIRMGTKVINELRLPLNDPGAQKVWDQHIREFLNLQS